MKINKDKSIEILKIYARTNQQRSEVSGILGLKYGALAV